LGDLSPRAEQALREADFWVVEDTRVSAKLALHLRIKPSMAVFHEHSTPRQLGAITGRIASGESAALLTDAGTPCISDPGAMLVDHCLSEEIPVDAIPGPSATTTALMLSGFFAQKYVFLGFLSRKPGPSKRELEQFAGSGAAIVLFESPHRLEATLGVAAEALGSRRYAICRELTKKHQQVYRGTLPFVPTLTEVPRRGEVTVVFEGRRRKSGFSTG